MTLHDSTLDFDGMPPAAPRDEELLDALFDLDLDALQPYLAERSFERGDILIQEQRPWPGLDVIISGRVALIRGDGAREQVLGILHPGEVLDVAPLALRDERCWFTARAIEPGRIYRLTAAEARRMAAECPAFQRYVARAMAGQLSRLARLVHDLAFKDVIERLASWLYDESLTIAPRPSGEIVLPRDLSLRELASMLGTAREVVSRALAKLAQSGTIRLEPGRIVVVDRSRLDDIAHQTER